jgi:2-keto-3-deoxy-L-rhamnonate aldolase RhmA
MTQQQEHFMAKTSSLGEKIRSGSVVVGTWMQIPHYMVAETMALGNFDFVLLDGEHAPVPPDALGGLLAAAERRDCPVIYRVRSNSEDLIKGALDSGIAGLFVPMINSRSEALRAVGAAKYPPMGHRGIGPWRASNYYLDQAAYVARANAEIPVVLQIETKAALKAVDEIATVEGVDVLYVGPADLATSLGLPVGELNPGLIAACRKIAAAARRENKVAGIDVASLDFVKTYRELGFSLFTYGSETGYIIDGARAASRALRKAAR